MSIQERLAKQERLNMLEVAWIEVNMQSSGVCAIRSGQLSEHVFASERICGEELKLRTCMLGQAC